MSQIVAAESLKSYLSGASKDITQSEYQEIARRFRSLAEACVNEIWQLHKGELYLALNGIEVATAGSAVNTSTAVGFLVEEFIVKQLPTIFSTGGRATGNSAFDFTYDSDPKIKLLVNLKVEKNTSTNTAIVAGNILRNEYLSDSRPRLYLILKSKYHIDEARSTLIFDGLESYFLESFITTRGGLKSDRRSWSEEFKILSGRLQLPAAKILSESGEATIPSPNKIRDFIENLAANLKSARE